MKVRLLKQLRYFLRMRLDPELRAVRGIITAPNSCEGDLQLECNKVFQERLRLYPKALKMSFWKSHFEWRDLLSYGEIQGRILDFGCGSGHSDVFLARAGKTVHGVDLSTIGIAIADYIRNREPIEIRQRVTFQCVDVVNCLPPEVPFDSAWSSHVFEHINDPGPIFVALRRWLQPGAYMLISVPLGHAYDDPSHVHHYETPDDLRRAFEKYVKVTRVDCDRRNHVLRAVCEF